ncbi:MAG: threonine synthase, partial [Muribaculaceae bacterium]|nr:threonine synthase [Muribaculaceae bacterium]
AESPEVSLEEAVVKGLASDNGLFMPLSFPLLTKDFIKRLPYMTLSEMAVEVAEALFGEDIDKDELRRITEETLNFPVPLKKVKDNIYSLELFHGPTLAFKDVGARFMARLLGYFNKNNNDRTVNVLVATSGDTGSAVANGFLGVAGVRVFVLYPKGKVSRIQEAQFTTLGKNITAIEIDGTFDDCQALVKKAFLDQQLNEKMMLTSANSINVARFLPQMFYYFHAYARAVAAGAEPDNVVFCVPSGNFGNITAGLIAKRMGLPVKRFIAANNANDVFLHYLVSGNYEPKPSVQTIANAMDVGNPSNFARVLDLYGKSHSAISKDISGVSYSDSQISDTLAQIWKENGYLLDPHGAVACRALLELLHPYETGIFLETAHPAKFKETVEAITKEEVIIPERLETFLNEKKQSVPLPADFNRFKDFLLSSDK